MLPLRHLFKSPALLFGVAFVLACSTDKRDSDASLHSALDSGATAVMLPDSVTGTEMGSMKNMTGDPDRDFLRMMSDHHKGMIAMAHPTIDSKEKLSVKDDARKMDKAQDTEIETMISMLSKQWKDDYTPSISASNQKMVDELKTKSGADYSRTFLKNVIAHHGEAIEMIDAYLPTAKNPDVKQMAEKMKADQTREISDFRQKLKNLGS